MQDRTTTSIRRFVARTMVAIVPEHAGVPMAPAGADAAGSGIDPPRFAAGNPSDPSSIRLRVLLLNDREHAPTSRYEETGGYGTNRYDAAPSALAIGAALSSSTFDADRVDVATHVATERFFRLIPPGVARRLQHHRRGHARPSRVPAPGRHGHDEAHSSSAFATPRSTPGTRRRRPSKARTSTPHDCPGTTGRPPAGCRGRSGRPRRCPCQLITEGIRTHASTTEVEL